MLQARLQPLRQTHREVAGEGGVGEEAAELRARDAVDEQVVLDGQNQLRPGAKVQARGPNGGGGPPAGAPQAQRPPGGGAPVASDGGAGRPGSAGR